MAPRKRKARKKVPKKATRKKAIKIQTSHAHHVLKFAILGSVMAFCLWLSIGLASAGLVSQTTTWISEKTLNATAEAGFKIREVTVSGRHHTDPELLRNLLNVERGDPIFAFAPHHASRFIEKISWIESVEIRRRLPDTVEVALTERVPVALWQHNETLAVIDRDGNILTRENLEDFSYLPILVGKDAHEHVNEIVGMLRAEPEIVPYINSITRVGKRRWNLELGNNTSVKLPEDEPELALSTLVHLHNTDNILEHNWDYIDLRLVDKVIFKPQTGAKTTKPRPIAFTPKHLAAPSASRKKHI